MNTEIKKQLRDQRIPQWRLAEAVGISENTMIRWMRHPLQGDQERRVREALDRLRNDQGVIRDGSSADH